jgi:predicted nuclease of predicted toxin-antitoxin system
MKFLIDMNLSPLWVPFLTERGFTAVHWTTVGRPWAADSEIFEFAAADSWVVPHYVLSIRFRVRFNRNRLV